MKSIMYYNLNITSVIKAAFEKDKEKEKNNYTIPNFNKPKTKKQSDILGMFTQGIVW